MVIFIVILSLFALILILLFLFARLYILLDWQIEQEDSHIHISFSILRFPIMKKKMDLSEIFNLQINKTVSFKNYRHSFKKVYPKIRLEDVTFDLTIGTGDPAYTALLYPYIQILETINAQKFRVSVDFENKLLQSMGQCMISIRLCHTRKVLGILKQLQGKGDA